MEIPPLRDRRDDIPALARHFVSLFRSRLNRPNICFTDEDAELLKQYDWPGNVRELQNVIERAVILAKNGRLRLDLALAYSRPVESPSTEISAPSQTNSSAGGDFSQRRFERTRTRQHHCRTKTLEPEDILAGRRR
jgi:DNA-binding NtrC family response regulator